MGNHIRTGREASGDWSLEKLLTISRRRPLVIVLQKIVDRALGTVLRCFQFGKQKWPTQEKDSPVVSCWPGETPPTTWVKQRLPPVSKTKTTKIINSLVVLKTYSQLNLATLASTPGAVSLVFWCPQSCPLSLPCVALSCRLTSP